MDLFTVLIKVLKEETYRNLHKMALCQECPLKKRESNIKRKEILYLEYISLTEKYIVN